MAKKAPTESKPTPAGDAPADDLDGSKKWGARLRSWAVQGLLLVVVVIGVQTWQQRDLISNREPAPGFELKRLDGQRVALSEYRGKTVLVHFWATWCGVCKQELGTLNAVQQNLEPDEVLLTIVEDSDDVEHLRRFVKEHDLQYPVLLATPDVIRSYRVSAFPTNYVIDHEGRIAGKDVGMATRWGLRSRMGCAK